MNKCLCECPDYIKIPLPNGARQTVYLKGFGTVLHGKKATYHCEICGQGLCRDCLVMSDYGLDDWELDWPAATALCPSCAEVTR